MSTRIVKNISSGLVAQVWTGILGLLALPIFARGLGPERYGLLALNLALINFAAVADLGVGRAASKYLAEDFERKETCRTQRYIGTAMAVTVLMGALGTLILAAVSPVLVHFAFRIPGEMQREAEIAFWITSAGLLAILLRILFDGVLAGHHQIASLNFGNVAASTLRLGLSIAAILTRHSLLAVLGINVVVSYLHALGLWLFAAHYFGGQLKIRVGWDRTIGKQLLGLGLGATLSWILANVVFLYVDRFLIAGFLPLAFAGYYTMAFDIATRQSYVSNSVTQAYFPVFSGQGATNASAFKRSFLQATKAVAVGTTGVAMLLVVFAQPLLTYWIGPAFAANARSSLIALAVASLLACYASVPYTAIIAGAGQPKVCVRTFGVAVGIHVVASLVLLRVWSIAGVAAAFALAYAYVFVSLSVWVSKILVPSRLTDLLKRCFLVPLASAVVIGTLLWFFVMPYVRNLAGVAIAFSAGYLVYFACCAALAYSSTERAYAREALLAGLRSSWRKSLATVVDEP
jgi:O-antigen/teichoic acid export membrane protein